MKTIHKYPLELTEMQFIEMPKDAKVLTAQSQDSKICLWAEVESHQPTELRRFIIYGTGFEMSDTEEIYIGTVKFKNLV